MAKNISLNEVNSWDDINTDEDLFNQITEESNQSTETENKTETVENPETESVQEETDESKSNEDLFDESNESEITKEDINEDVQSSYSKETLNYLFNNEFIDKDENDSFDFDTASDTDIDFYIREKLDKSVDQHVEMVLNDLPDVVKQLNKYVINGGDFNDFIQYYNANQTVNNFNIDTPENQKTLISNGLKQQGYTDEYIESQLEFLENTNRLELTAKEQYKLYQKQLQEEQEKLYKQQEAQIEEQKKQEKEYRTQLHSIINSSNNIGDLTISKQDKNTLSNFITDRKIKLENGQYITELQKELFYDIPQNNEAMLQLALLVKNRNADGTFNFDNIKKQTETQITKQIKNNLQRNKPIVPNDTKDRRQYTRKSLADYFG